MKKKWMMLAVIAIGMITSSCVSSKGGLSDEAMNNIETRIWYDNANLLVKANDPDLKADTFIGVPQLDAVVDTVKDILVLAPVWTTTRVEEKQFRDSYLDSIMKLSTGQDESDLTLKCKAFKIALLMNTFTEEVEHAKAAVAMSADEKKVNYAQNAEVFNRATAKVIDYANNQIYVLNNYTGDDERKDFLAVPERQAWNARTDEIVQRIKDISLNIKDEEQAEAAIAKLSRDMGVQEVDWKEVEIRLAGDLEKLTNALQQFAYIMQSDSELHGKIVNVAFGGEIVEGISGKETLAVIKRVGKQMKVNVELLTWLVSMIGK